MAILKITGIKQSTGRMDNGFTYDHAVVFAVSMLDPSNDKVNGFAGIELRGLPEIYQKYLGYKFEAAGVPFEVTIEQVATGKGAFKDTIVAMTPVAPRVQQQQPKPAAASVASPT